MEFDLTTTNGQQQLTTSSDSDSYTVPSLDSLTSLSGHFTELILAPCKRQFRHSSHNSIFTDPDISTPSSLSCTALVRSLWSAVPVMSKLNRKDSKLRLEFMVLVLRLGSM